MEQRKVSVEMMESRARGASDASASSPSFPANGKDFFGKFIIYLVFFSTVGAVLSSKLPLMLGAILYFSNDDFIAWVLRKVGIQLVPDSLGANFISAGVFLAGVGVLLSYFRESLPAWLSERLPPSFSWTLVIGGALGCAVLACAVAGVTRLLSWAGIDVRPDSLAGATVRAVIGFAILGLLCLVLSTPMVEAWIGVN